MSEQPNNSPEPTPVVAKETSAVSQTLSGVAWLTLAKGYFMLAGASVQFLATYLVPKSVFGALSVVSSVISPINNVMVTATLQAVSRSTAQGADTPSLLRAARTMHLRIAIGVFLLCACGSPLLARLLGDSSKTALILAASPLVAIYAFYAIVVGVYNGGKQFRVQAMFDIAFATFRSGLMLLGAALLGTTAGILGGWLVAATALLIGAWYVVRHYKSSIADALPPTQWRTLTVSFLGLAAPAILINVLLFLDTWQAKRLLSQMWHQITPGAFSVAESSDTGVAYYTAAQNLARLSYQGMMAVVLSLFPVVATIARTKKISAKNTADLSKMLKLVTLAATVFAIGLTLTSNFALHVIYPDDYVPHALPLLRVLAFANALLAIASVWSAVLGALGQERKVAVLFAVTCAVLVGVVQWSTYAMRSSWGPNLSEGQALVAQDALLLRIAWMQLFGIGLLVVMLSILLARRAPGVFSLR